MTESKRLRDRLLVQGTEALQRSITDEQERFFAVDVHLRPLVYIDGWENELCADCAEARLVEAESFDDLDEYICWEEDQVKDVYLHFEGADAICHDCNDVITSYYGDPDDED